MRGAEVTRARSLEALGRGRLAAGNRLSGTIAASVSWRFIPSAPSLLKVNYRKFISRARVTGSSETHVSMPKERTGPLYDGLSTSASQGPYWRVWVFLGSLRGTFTRSLTAVQFCPAYAGKGILEI